MSMKTILVQADAASIAQAASLLRAGEVVAFPTETVYGLGADGTNAQAVAGIFRAKDRPADNPLILHIDQPGMLAQVTDSVDARAQALMRAFWPGALTLLFRRLASVPDIVSAGLPTVGVRMPSHPVARAIIAGTGCPIAAPSANRSGRPSPTTAAHVLQDLGGRIPLIIDGGASGYGVESTVLDITGNRPVLLRPGGVTLEMLRDVLPDIEVDPTVLQPLASGQEARSPGMKHRHYAPSARVVVVRGEASDVSETICRRAAGAAVQGLKAGVLCAEEQVDAYEGLTVYSLGTTADEMSARLFGALRAMDAQGVDVIFAEATQTQGMGLALMNRLLRAADFDVIDV